MEINASIPVYMYPNSQANIVYKQTVVRVTDNMQNETVLTYDKNGQLLETVTRKHDIGSV
jgi:YD repeat-containing protein